jgi:transcription elongation GreA/GreB family factor
MKDLKYWKGRSVDIKKARIHAKRTESAHYEEFKIAHAFARRRVKDLERKLDLRKVT